ncbi:hypothetical protein LP419_35415 [Massilia sp. H-1]|nr:hypothetical protein LP419_35415 [Massilia sp. H-1]
MVGAERLAATAQDAEQRLRLVPPPEQRWDKVASVMAEAELAVRAAAEQVQSG